MTRKGGAALNNTKKSNQRSSSKSRSPEIIETGTDIEVLINGEKVGSTKCLIKGTEFSINNIFIEQPHRGKGLGKIILKMTLATAFKEKDINLVKLTNATQSNQFNPNKIPNKMYEKAGFVYMYPEHVYFGKDMILTREMYERITLKNGYL